MPSSMSARDRRPVGPGAEGADPAEELASLLESQDVVREVMKGFLHLGTGETGRVIDDALARLGAHLDVDRSYVFVFDPPEMDNTHEWCRAGVSPESPSLQRVPIDAVAGWLDELIDGDVVVIEDVPGLPDERGIERDHLVSQGILSLLVVPMLSLGELVGLVGFDSVRRHRRFVRAEIGLLRSLADVITSVLVRQRSDEKAAVAEQRLAALTTYSTDFIMIVGDDQLIRFASPSCEHLGLVPDELIATSWFDHVHPDDVREIFRLTRPMADQQLAERVIRLPDFRVRTGRGGWCWMAGSISDVRHDGVVDGLVVNAHDVTDRRGVQEQLAYEALHDPLTGLGNRTLLTERLHDVCRRSSAGSSTVALVFLDLDRFKLVNDGHGHAVGDEVLVEVACRLATVVRSGDTVIRFGGDEFVVLLDAVDEPDEVDQLVRRLEQALDPPVRVGDVEYRVSASMGVVLGSGDVLDPIAMLRDADTAMYRAKESGRGRAVVFDEPLRTKVLRKLTLLHRLPEALDGGAIEVGFQPVVELRTGRVIGAEALVRWNDEVLGVVSPGELVTAAEEAGLIARLTQELCGASTRAAASWPDGLGVALNLSLAQLTHPDLIPTISTALGRHGLDASRLCVEVTESSLMDDQTNAVWALGLLREAGIRTALDDFGTGYTSLAVLRELPVDVLKVDRAFVRGVHRDERDRRLVAAVIGLAGDFDMVTLAEGVENVEQRSALVAAGCSYGQGYLFGRPMSSDAFRATLGDVLERPSAT